MKDRNKFYGDCWMYRLGVIRVSADIHIVRTRITKGARVRSIAKLGQWSNPNQCGNCDGPAGDVNEFCEGCYHKLAEAG